MVIVESHISDDKTMGKYLMRIAKVYLHWEKTKNK